MPQILVDTESENINNDVSQYESRTLTPNLQQPPQETTLFYNKEGRNLTFYMSDLQKKFIQLSQVTIQEGK